MYPNGRRRFQNNNNGQLLVVWVVVFFFGCLLLLTNEVDCFAPAPGGGSSGSSSSMAGSSAVVEDTHNNNSINRKRNFVPTRRESKMASLLSSTNSNNNNNSETTTSSSAETTTLSSSNPSGGLFGFFGIANPNKPTMAINILILTFLVWKRNIPQSDILFSIFYSLYLCCVNRFRFDRNKLGCYKEQTSLLREGRGPWFKKYVTFYGLIGLLIPLPICLFATTTFADAAAPHLFLTVCQVMMEKFSKSPYFHALPRLLIPIGFNTFRIRTLWIWTKQSYEIYFNQVSKAAAGWDSIIFPAFGLGLAVISLVGWMYNLFIFLLLRTLPQYLNRDEFPDPNINWKGAIIPVLVDKGAED